MDTLTLRDGYDRTKHPRTLTVRLLTLEEIKALHAGQRVKFLSNEGTVRELTINGKPKTWKTRPTEVSVPVKYGMYEYARFETHEATARLLTIVRYRCRACGTETPGDTCSCDDNGCQ